MAEALDICGNREERNLKNSRRWCQTLRHLVRSTLNFSLAAALGIVALGVRKPHNYLTDSPEFGLTFALRSGEKWGVVAENVTRDLNLNESGCENALFRDFRAFDGREEARGSTCAVAY